MACQNATLDKPKLPRPHIFPTASSGCGVVWSADVNSSETDFHLTALVSRLRLCWTQAEESVRCIHWHAQPNVQTIVVGKCCNVHPAIWIQRVVLLQHVTG